MQKYILKPRFFRLKKIATYDGYLKLIRSEMKNASKSLPRALKFEFFNRKRV